MIMSILGIVPLFIGTTELLLIGGLVLLLFGGKKLPEMMKGLGQGVRSFKEGVNELDPERIIKDAPTSKRDKIDSENKTDVGEQ